MYVIRLSGFGIMIFLNYVHMSDGLTTLVIVFNVQMNRRLKMQQKNVRNLKKDLLGCAVRKLVNEVKLFLF